MKKWNPMNVFSYCMIGVGFAAISVAIGMYINLGMTEILKNFVVWMIGGAIIGLLSLIYETEQLSNVKATLIHAPLTCLIALICGWICGYGEHSVSLLIVRMLPTIAIIYVVIHAILYLLHCASVHSINQKLNK